MKKKSRIKLSNNSFFFILIFAISKFRQTGRSTFRRFKFWSPPLISYFPHWVPLISIVARTPTMKFSILFFLPVFLHIFFQFSSYVSFIFNYPHRLLSLGIRFKMQFSPNSRLIPNSSSHSMYLSPPFLLGLRLGTLAPSYRWASARLDLPDRSTALAFRLLCFFHLSPSLPI